jgi:hypothetical protein
MAKGKRSSGNHYTSKGERRNVAKSTTKLGKRDYANSMERLQNQYEAHSKGKRVMLTVANPNKNQTNMPFIKVPSAEVWGSWKRR